MAAPDRARFNAAVEFCPDALAHHCIDADTTIQAFVVEAIREKLKRDGRQDGHDIIKRFRQHNDFVSNFLEMLRAISAGQRDDRPLAGFHLLDVVQVF